MQTDRINFIKNIDCNISLIDIFKQYFDEVMALYDLVGTCKDFTVKGDVEETIIFNITFTKDSDAKKLKSIIDNITITKYNRNFKCSVQHTNNTLCVNLH